MTGSMQERLDKIEDAVIELGKIDVLLRMVTGEVEASPKVEDIQNFFFVVEELFSSKYKTLKAACYGEADDA